MRKKIFKNKLWVVAFVCLTFVWSSSDVYAWSKRNTHDHDREVVVVKHQKYHYYGGRFYRPGWFGIDIALVVPPFGAVVRRLPVGHTILVVGGTRYYYYDKIYYTECPSGYVVVSAPAANTRVAAVPSVVVEPEKLSGETVTINVPNSNGSFTPVTLTKYENGHIGPQGEYYPGNPTVDQLKVLYAK